MTEIRYDTTTRIDELTDALAELEERLADAEAARDMYTGILGNLLDEIEYYCRDARQAQAEADRL